MALVLKDRVKETTTTTGTGTYTLAGASTGFQSFAVIGNGNPTYYAATDGTDWEVGIGTYTSSGTTLSRDTILESSNSGNAVNWGAGSKDIFVTYPAEKSSITFPQGAITSNYTASINEGVLTDTTSGAFTVTLPSSPINGAIVVVADISGTWGTNNLTIGRNGSTIAGLAEDLVCNISGVLVQFIYDGSTWGVFAQVGANDTDVVTVNGTQTLTNKTITGLKEKSTAVAASDIDLATGNYFTKTISGTTTFTVSNVATSGDVGAFVLVMTNGGSATVNWFSGVTWASGTAPTLTASGVDVLAFFTIDGGTTWRGFVLGYDMQV